MSAKTKKKRNKINKNNAGYFLSLIHIYRSIEIFAIFEGSLRFFLNEEEYKMNAGEFLLVNSNEVHSIFSPKPNVTVVIQIPLVVFKKYYTNEQFISFSHEPRVRNQELMKLMHKMYDTYVKKECGYEFRVQSYFYELLYTLVTEYRDCLLYTSCRNLCRRRWSDTSV